MRPLLCLLTYLQGWCSTSFPVFSRANCSPCHCRLCVSGGGVEVLWRILLWRHLGQTTSSISGFCSILEFGLYFPSAGNAADGRVWCLFQFYWGKRRDFLCKSPVSWHWGEFITRLIPGKLLKLDSAPVENQLSVPLPKVRQVPILPSRYID